MTRPLAARSRKTQSITVLVHFRASSHRQIASTASKITPSVQSRSAVGKKPHPGFRAYSTVNNSVTSPTGDEETPVREVSSLDSQMQVDAGAEDKEEEVATEDPAVEQEEEHDDESVWEVKIHPP